MAPQKPKPDDAPVTIIKDINEFMAHSISRLDEKVNNTLEKQEALSKRFEKLFDHYNNLLERVVNVESKNIGEVKRNLDDLLIKVVLIEKSLDNISKDTNKSSETLKSLENENDELNFFKRKTEEKLKFGFDSELVMNSHRLLIHTFVLDLSLMHYEQNY